MEERIKMAIYTYFISTDFSLGIDLNCLNDTIKNYGFSNNFDGVTAIYDDDEVNIEFVGSLSPSDEDDLDVIVSNHDPGNCVEESDVGNVIGAAGYAVSEAQSSTNSTTPIRKLRLAITELPIGTYRIGWYYEWASSSGSSDFRARIQLNDTDDLMYHSQEAKDSGTDQNIPVCGYAYKDLTEGSHNIDLDFWHERYTAYIQSARLEIWRVN